MAILALPGSGARQPQQPTSINWNHELAQGLKFFIAPCGSPQLFDHVNGKLATPSRTHSLRNVQLNAKASLATNFVVGSSDVQSLPDLATYNILGDISLIWGGVIDTTTQYHALVGKIVSGGNGATNCPFDFRTDVANPTKPVLVRASASAFTTWTGTGGISLSTYHQVAVTLPVAGTTATFYVDTVSSTSVVSAITPTATTSQLRIGLRADSAVALNGATEFVAGWGRVLSASEIKSMYDNPWQIFMSGIRIRAISPAVAAFQPAWSINSNTTIQSGVRG